MTTVAQRWRIICLIAFYFLSFHVNSTNASRSPDSKWRTQIPVGFNGLAMEESTLGKPVCSLAGGVPTHRIVSNLRSLWSDVYRALDLRNAPFASGAVADIEFDRFSGQRFAQIGFTPQCLFADESSPQGYLETKIDETLLCQPDPIYQNNDFTWIVESEEKDPYWQYYADCDHWGIVFQDLDQPGKVSKWIAKFKAKLEERGQHLATFLEPIVEYARWIEFQWIETSTPCLEQNHPIQQGIIDGIKSYRPVIKEFLPTKLAKKSLIWADDVHEKWEASLLGTVWHDVWCDVTQIQYLGLVAVTSDAEPVRRVSPIWALPSEIGNQLSDLTADLHESLRFVPSQDAYLNGSEWSQRVNWLAKRLEQVVDVIQWR